MPAVEFDTKSKASLFVDLGFLLTVPLRGLSAKTGEFNPGILEKKHITLCCSQPSLIQLDLVLFLTFVLSRTDIPHRGYSK